MYYLKNLADYIIFNARSKYPTKMESCNQHYENLVKFQCKIGLSDHQLKYIQQYMHHNGNLVEVHVTFNKQMFGVEVISYLNFGVKTVICIL